MFKFCLRKSTLCKYFCERFESFFLSNTCFGHFLFFIWSIEIFYSGECICLHDLFTKFVSQESFFIDKTNNGLFTSFKVFGIAINIMKFTKLFVSGSFSKFFTVPCDEWNGISLIKKFDDCFYSTGFHIGFGRYELLKCRHIVSLQLNVAV